MDFKSSNQVINKITKTLSSFVLSGQIDESDFYEDIYYILELLNIPAFNQKSTVLEVINGTTNLPSDFKELYALWFCNIQDVKRIHKKDYQNTFTITTEETCYENIKDISGCESVRPTDFKTFKRDIFFEYDVESTSYNTSRLLKPQSISCINCSKNTDEYELIGNNFLKLNITQGTLLLQYKALELDEDGLPMIPDIVQIEKVIESYIIYKSFQKIYYNGLSDVRERMQFANQEYLKDFEIAKSYINLPTWKSMIKYGIKRSKNYLELQLPEIRNQKQFDWFYTKGIAVQDNYNYKK